MAMVLLLIPAICEGVDDFLNLFSLPIFPILAASLSLFLCRVSLFELPFFCPEGVHY